MKLEDQVCTKEQAKKLKELGVEQKGLFVHINAKYSSSNILLLENIHSMDLEEERFSAFTVAELGVMITSDKIIDWPVGVGYDNKDWHLFYTKNKYRDIDKSKHEAYIRAAMLIYLLENNYTTSEEVNKRLYA